MKIHVRLTAKHLETRRTITDVEVIWVDDDLNDEQAFYFVQHLAQFHYISYLAGPFDCQMEFWPVKQLTDDIAYN